MTKAPILPRVLRSGDTLAVLAPSSRLKAEDIDVGVAMLRGWGYEVRLLPSVSSSRAYLAGESDQAKGAELTDCFADPEINGIICARGGYGAMRVLPFVDWDAVRANPKLFCGYSDITALHLALRREANVVTFHGPMVARQSGEDGLDRWTADQFRRALSAVEPLGVVAPPDDGPVPVTVRGGVATGPLVGGNLTLLAAMCGTRWQLDTRDCVLLLEDTNEQPYRIDRYLTQLLLTGVLDGLRGVVFGYSPDCDRPPDDPRTFTLAALLEERLGPLNIPILYGFPCGHQPHRATLPLNLPVTLDADAGTLTYVDPACRP